MKLFSPLLQARGQWLASWGGLCVQYGNCTYCTRYICSSGSAQVERQYRAGAMIGEGGQQDAD